MCTRTRTANSLQLALSEGTRGHPGCTRTCVRACVRVHAARFRCLPAEVYFMRGDIPCERSAGNLAAVWRQRAKQANGHRQRQQHQDSMRILFSTWGVISPCATHQAICLCSVRFMFVVWWKLTAHCGNTDWERNRMMFSFNRFFIIFFALETLYIFVYY